MVRPSHTSVNSSVSLGTNPTGVDLGSVFFRCSLEGKRHFLGCGESKPKGDHHTSGDIDTYTLPSTKLPASSQVDLVSLGSRAWDARVGPELSRHELHTLS